MATANFDAHWLAEAVRLREARDGRLDDAALLPLLQQAADFETRALVRAQALGERLGWHEALAHWHGGARLSALLLAALACSSGALLALGTLGDGSRPVNLIWALLGLLGLHGASLLLWLLAMLHPGKEAGAALGRLWLRLLRRLPAARETPELGRALPRLLARDGLGRWLFGAVSHGLWTLLLASALLTLLALFSLRRYGFVWETTILSPETLSTLLSVLDALPRLVGLGAPDGATLLGPQDDALRATWARWLMVALLLYGLLPRLLLWGGCRFAWQRAGRALRLDMRLPDNLLLRRHLMPEHGASRIADPAPAQLGSAHLPRPAIDAAAGGALVGIELGPDLAWPPPLAAPLRLIERIDGRADRQRTLERLAAAPPRRLLVAFDARLSPDRGSYALLAQLAAHAGNTAAWLAGDGERDAARLRHWRDGLAEAGLPAEHVVSERDAAMLWLEHADD